MASNSNPTDGRSRRTVLKSIGTVGLIGLAGCTDSASSSGSSASTQTATGNAYTASGGATTTAVTHQAGENADTDELGFEIDYSGEWSGSISAGGQQQSIDGYGSRTGNINPPPDYATLTAQKEEEYGTLYLYFYFDGQVVQEGSTSADYGVVTISVNRN